MKPEVNSYRYEISKPFTWRFHCGNFPNHSETLLHMLRTDVAVLVKTDAAVLTVFSITVATHMRTSY